MLAWMLAVFYHDVASALIYRTTAFIVIMLLDSNQSNNLKERADGAVGKFTEAHTEESGQCRHAAMNPEKDTP